MISPSELDALLNSLPEPAFVIARDGSIEHSNLRARDVTPSAMPGTSIYQFSGEEGRLRNFLSRASGTNQPCVGSLTLITGGGVAERFGAVATRLSSITAEHPRLFIRCNRAVDERFSILTKRIDELNSEVHKRRHLQAVLEETLRERELLVREIHHRVKNNVQMISSMLRFAERETDNLHAKAVLVDAARRIASVAAIQQVLHQSHDLGSMSGSDLVHTVLGHIRQTVPPAVQVDVQVEPVPLSTEQAIPLTLIINELVTNAVKHGLKGDPNAPVTVTLRRKKGQFELCVHNPGAGFQVAETGRRSSGLGLVRGLVRQLEGTFEVGTTDGVTCKVRFGNSENVAKEVMQ